MNRPFVGIGLVFGLVATLVFGLMWYMTLGAAPSGNESVESTFVSSTTTLRLGSGIEVESPSEIDAYYALGYAHGTKYSWPIALLRQTALGRLGEWFGDETLPLDRFAKTLGFSTTAEQAISSLDPEDLEVLDAYSKGISKALERKDVILDDQLVLFDITLDPWEAGHSLAIEKLIAWLSEPPARPSQNDTAYGSLKSFQDADELMRSWLHLHGFEHSSAWVFDDSTGSTIQSQFVYGATSLPLFVPVSMSWQNAELEATSLIGTPFLPFITGPAGTHVILLSSSRRVANRFDFGFSDSTATSRRHERIRLSSGREELIEVDQRSQYVFFSTETFSTGLHESLTRGTVAWAGLRPITDWPSWRHAALKAAGLSTSRVPDFELFDGNGLYVESDGRKTILGSPAIAKRGRGGRIFVASTELGVFAGDRFLKMSKATDESFVTDVRSRWAEATVPVALSTLGGDSTFSESVQEAIDYLRNWDLQYDLASIGATIFDSWMATYSNHSDPFPAIILSTDSLELATTQARLRDALTSTVDSLLRIGGSDLGRWRLETFRSGLRFSPVWSYPALENNLPAVAPQKFAALVARRPGHPTALAWQSGLFDYPANSPSHVLSQATLGGSYEFAFRPDYLRGSGLIARHVVTVPDPLPTTLSNQKITAQISLVPATTD